MNVGLCLVIIYIIGGIISVIALFVPKIDHGLLMSCRQNRTWENWDDSPLWYISVTFLVWWLFLSFKLIYSLNDKLDNFIIRKNEKEEN